MQIRPADIGHHIISRAVHLKNIPHPYNVGVIELPQQLRFHKKAVEEVPVIFRTCSIFPWINLTGFLASARIQGRHIFLHHQRFAGFNVIHQIGDTKATLPQHAPYLITLNYSSLRQCYVRIIQRI